MGKDQRNKGDRFRYGIGEWYGRPFDRLPSAERQRLAEMLSRPKREREPMPCPSRTEAGMCPKEGGVCSLRVYCHDGETGKVTVAPGQLVTTCPLRFDENGTVFRWIGETILGHDNPLVVRAVEGLTAGRPVSLEVFESRIREKLSR